MNLICLSFIQAFQGQMAHIPPQVDQYVKTHIASQMSLESPESKFKFDDKSCPSQGTYIYSGDSLVLVADSDIWKGRAEIPLNDILDGKKIYFPPLVSARQELEASNLSPDHSTSGKSSETPKIKKRKWLPWILAGTGILIGGIIASQQRKRGGPSDNPAPTPPPEPVPTMLPESPRPTTVSDP